MTRVSIMALAALVGATLSTAPSASAEQFLFVQPGPGASAPDPARINETRAGLARLTTGAAHAITPAATGTDSPAPRILAATPATAPLTSPRPVPRPHSLGVVVVSSGPVALHPLPSVGIHRLGIAPLAMPVRYTMNHDHDRIWFFGFPARDIAGALPRRIDMAAEDALEVIAQRTAMPDQILNDPVFRALPMQMLRR